MLSVSFASWFITTFNAPVTVGASHLKYTFRKALAAIVTLIVHVARVQVCVPLPASVISIAVLYGVVESLKVSVVLSRT